MNLQQDVGDVVTIAGRSVGPGFPPLIVAELSGNHNGDVNRALALIEAAKMAGAGAVKFQTYTADTITIDSTLDDFVIKEGLWRGRTLHELYDEAHTPWEWHEAMFHKAKELDLIAFSTPFDGTAADFLERFDVPAYKIASFEMMDLPLVASIARKAKPLIISTGMANFDEIEEVMSEVQKAGGNEVVLLHCVSAYPAPADQMNLLTMLELGKRFGTVIGLSDHTLDNVASISAVALGACVIEKHITLVRADGGPDSAFSLEPHEFKDLCRSCHTAWAARGRVTDELEPSESGNLVFRRSLYVVDAMAAGEEFTEKNVRSIRPGFGLAPKLLPKIFGRRATTAIAKGTALRAELIAGWTGS